MPKSRWAGRQSPTRPAPFWRMRPGGLRIEAGDGAQQRRLAAARGTEEADQLARRDVSEMSPNAVNEPKRFHRFRTIR